MTLDAFEFIRRFLQHVLPSGFQKVRHFGFLSPNSSESIAAVRWLVTLYYGLLFLLRGDLPAAIASESPVRCPRCGGPMHIIGFLPPGSAVVFDTS
jgi:Putative transposase